MGRVFLNKLTAPREPIYENLSATIAAADWEASEFTNIIKNDVTCGGVTSTQQDLELLFNFTTNNLTGNDFTNLPPQEMTFSSDATTGPVTLTKQAGQGAFQDKFVGAQIRVIQPSGPPVIYTVSERVDADTLTVYYQPSPSQGQTLASLTNTAGGGSSNMLFLFVDLNGTSDPNIQYARLAGFNEQLSTFHSIGGIVKGGSMQSYFNVPNNSVSLNALTELSNPGAGAQPRGLRYYALIYDNTASYVAKAEGVRKIAKIENGNTFINTDPNFLSETWSQAGGDLRFITPYAIEEIAANRVTPAEWAQATVFPSLAGVTQITIALGLAGINNGEDAATGPGIELTFNIEIVDTSVGFNNTNFITLELNMDDGDLSNFGAIKAAWNNGVAYYEVIQPNVIRFYSGFTANEFTVDVPLQVKVIK